MTNLQTIRKAAGLSQSQLSKAAGVPVRTIQALESGARDINKLAVITAVQIARVLGCRIEDMLEGV